MAQILRDVMIDVAQKNVFQAIVAKQYDKQSRYLHVTITNLGEPMLIQNSSTVIINARREDNAARSFMGTVNADGTVTVPLTYWMLELDGKVECDISIVSGTEVLLTTTLFELDVEYAAVSNEDIESDDDCSVLLQLIQDVQTTASNLTQTYEASANDLKNLYESSMSTAIHDCETATAAAQLVTGPFYILDNDNHKTYQAAIQVTNNKPILIYDEFQGGN